MSHTKFKVKSLKDQAAAVVARSEIDIASKERRKRGLNAVKREGLRSSNTTEGALKEKLDKKMNKRWAKENINQAPLPDELKKKIKKNFYARRSGVKLTNK